MTSLRIRPPAKENDEYNEKNKSSRVPRDRNRPPKTERCKRTEDNRMVKKALLDYQEEPKMIFDENL